MVELKTSLKSSISIERDSQGQIKRHQYDQMYSRQGEREKGGFVLQFLRDSDKQVTYFLPIDNFIKFLEESDKKSINIKDVESYGGILVEEYKNWYNVKKMLDT